MSGNKSLFNDISHVPPSPVGLPNRTKVIATEAEMIISSDKLHMSNVLYVPDLTCNLISVSQLLHTSYYNVTFTDTLPFI